jgi:hypothetical protein
MIKFPPFSIATLINPKLLPPVQRRMIELAQKNERDRVEALVRIERDGQFLADIWQLSHAETIARIEQITATTGDDFDTIRNRVAQGYVYQESHP